MSNHPQPQNFVSNTGYTPGAQVLPAGAPRHPPGVQTGGGIHGPYGDPRSNVSSVFTNLNPDYNTGAVPYWPGQFHGPVSEPFSSEPVPHSGNQVALYQPLPVVYPTFNRRTNRYNILPYRQLQRYNRRRGDTQPSQNYSTSRSNRGRVRNRIPRSVTRGRERIPRISYTERGAAYNDARNLNTELSYF